VTSLKEAVYVGIALAIGFSIREYVRAAVTVRLGDPTPKQYGWASLNPKPKFDPFGTGFVPILVLVLIASGVHILPPFAYGKPLPLNPGNLRRPARDQTTIALSGPLANLALAAVAGALLRFGLPREGIIAVLAFFSTNLFLCVLHVMPIPGLDGSRIVARLLPPKAAETYRNLDPWLPLFVLVLFFVFGGIFFDIVNAITGGLCRVLAGSGVC
jgi:Zn-dependent protease